MSNVQIGSARIDENGHITGGTAGDQTCKEVSTQNYYVHTKGWRVLRAKDSAVGNRIAQAMKAACTNEHIGYDQSGRNTLFRAAQPLGYDPSLVSSDCETDCSALVRVCVCYAGVSIGDFNTSTEADKLLATGAFMELEGTTYTAHCDFLRKGDILVTKTKGHTVVILDDGALAYTDVSTSYAFGERTLMNGVEGDDVKTLQRYLIELGYSVGAWGVDGDFGDSTEYAVRLFQLVSNLAVDGIVGKHTVEAIERRIFETSEVASPTMVCIQYGNCYERKAPNTSAEIVGTAAEHSYHPYLGERSENGWLKISDGDMSCWVSGKYGVLV